MFSGSIVALATPFKNGKLDEKALEELVEFQIANGTDAIVPCGTTGESATMSHEEDIHVVKRVIDIVNKRIPVIAGAGSNNTAEAIYLSEAAKKNGADGVLIVSPYYNKPTQEGIFQHYKSIAETAKLPVVLYNVPSRTGGTGILADTVIRLSDIPNIVAIKDATGGIDSAMTVMKARPDFTVLSGEDVLTFSMMALGAKGVISTSANVIPAEMHKICEHMKKGEYADARKIHYKYLDLFGALFIETNPIPVKEALHMMGKMELEYRLPLVPMAAQNREKLRTAMQKVGLI